MKKNTRFLLAVILILAIAGVILGVDAVQRGAVSRATSTSTPLPAGSIPVYLDGSLSGGIVSADLEKLEKVSFVDAEEGKTQDGWLLREALLAVLPVEDLEGAQVVVSSSSRGKSAELSWEEIDEPANMVMFDLSNRGTLKLVSLLPKLDTRDEFVQDVDRIEITRP